MKKSRLYLLMLLLFSLVTAASELRAQNGFRPGSYVNLSSQLTRTDFVGGSQSSIIPSVSNYNGFGSFLQNPAVMALSNDSELAFSFNLANVSEDATYLQNQINANSSRFAIGDIGLVYKLPIYQGTLVLGGGYTTKQVYNRINESFGFNDRTSVTDYFKQSGSGFEDIAFETFAIDRIGQNSSINESIFRIDTEFLGLDQNIQRRQYGSSGEFAFFGALEFQKDLFVGLSLGHTRGNHFYSNRIIESDTDNLYAGEILPSDVSGSFTDVDFIEFNEEIESNFFGWNIRPGFVYDGEYFQLGGSMTIYTGLIVKEDSYAFIQNNLDDGSSPFFDEQQNGFDYVIERSPEYQAGLGITPTDKIELTASLRYFDPSADRINFGRKSGGLRSIERAQLALQEGLVNEQIRDSYKSATEYRFGGKYRFDKIMLLGGYSYLPSSSKLFDSIRTSIRGGVNINLTREWSIDLLGQYSVWNDRSVIYDFEDDSGTSSELTSIRANALNFMMGFRYKF